MGSTVLVTGATGKTGRRLVPLLLERGVTVRAASRHPEPAGVRFDWHEPDTYPAALRDVDAVYLVDTHLADNEVVDPNAEVRAFLDSAADAGVRRVVLLSSFGVDHAPDTDPMRRTEILVESAGIPSTVLRPAAFMQNFSERHWSGMVTMIRERGEIAMPGGAGRVSYVSTHDIAAVAAVALTEDGHDGKGYTLTGPEPLTLAEVAEHLSAVAGHPVRYVETGADAVRDGLLASGASAAFAGHVTAMYVGAVTTNVMAVVTDDIATVTGRPATRFADFAADAAEAWRLTPVLAARAGDGIGADQRTQARATPYQSGG